MTSTLGVLYFCCVGAGANEYFSEYFLATHEFKDSSGWIVGSDSYINIQGGSFLIISKNYKIKTPAVAEDRKIDFAAFNGNKELVTLIYEKAEHKKSSENTIIQINLSTAKSKKINYPLVDLIRVFSISKSGRYLLVEAGQRFSIPDSSTRIIHSGGMQIVDLKGSVINVTIDKWEGYQDK